MPRRKPFSAKQRKAQIQEKRATKRGESPPPTKSTQHSTPRHASRPQRSLAADPTSAKLQSRFVALSPKYLETTRDLAFSTPLARPIPDEYAKFPVDDLVLRDQGRLICPSRPKFRFGQTKKEVEKNEEGMFKKWLRSTEGIVKEWVEQDVEGSDPDGSPWPRSPSWFETNLEVWRQLWRVTESSSILLLLMDSRCPPLHCPPSLRSYIQSAKTHKEVVIVLTKSDMVDPSALDGWKEWTKAWWGRPVEVVTVTSYDQAELEESGRHRPDIPLASMQSLLDALHRCHERLLTPPDRVREDEENLARWSPSVRTSVDWEGLKYHGESQTHGEGLHADGSEDEDMSDEGYQSDEPAEGEESEGDTPAHKLSDAEPPLTIGLIGQPNVGKSSLLNALLGEQKVRASKTPGKTKHFQTMFWGAKREVKLVDCPGLVCPSLVGLEIQALAGILPISQIPSLPACIYYAARLVPLEQIFRIPPPEAEDLSFEAKKTWRTPRPVSEKTEQVVWTAGSIMEGRALDRGFLTAKGGRPDANRAANGIMRSLAEGKIRWGFWSPDAEVGTRQGNGIYLDHKDDLDTEIVAHPTERSQEDAQAPASVKTPAVSDSPPDRYGLPANTSGSIATSPDVASPVYNLQSGFFAALDDSEGEGGSEEEEEDDGQESERS